MTVLVTQVAAATARSVAPNLASLSRVFNALPRFQRAYITGKLFLSNRSLLSSRGLATAANTTRSTTKKATTARTARTTRTKKAAPKKKRATTPKKKPSRASAKPKRRAAKPKKKAAPRKKKVLTAASKEKALRQKSLALINELKLKALSPPALKAVNPYALFVSSHPASNFKEKAAAYKLLSASEKEQFSRQAEHNKMENEATYHNWVLQHTPEQIRLANGARSSLRLQLHKLYPKRKINSPKTGFPAIKDDRQVKRAKSAYTMYSTERLHGALHSLPGKVAIKNIAQEWKEMSPAEKKKYEELRDADKLRFAREYTSTYGHAYKSPSASLSP